MGEPVVLPSGGAARRIALTAAGLVLMAAAFAFAVPRRAEIAGDAAPAAAAVSAPARTDAAPAREPAEAAGRDVTPDGLTGAPKTGDGTLRRVAARPAPQALPAASGQPSSAEAAREEPAPESPPPKPKPMRVLARPIAVDTATFLVGKARVALAGVEPLPPTRECDAGGGRTWPCGMQARTALRGWLRARSIRCDVPKDFATSDSTTTSDCALGTKDIGAWLVENGWAEAAPGSRYVAAEKKARAARIGIWGRGRD